MAMEVSGVFILIAGFLFQEFEKGRCQPCSGESLPSPLVWEKCRCWMGEKERARDFNLDGGVGMQPVQAAFWSYAA